MSRQPAYNANGSVTADNGNTFTYDGRERLVGANATAYYVSGVEQRIEKAGPGTTAASGVQQFVYDEQGRLIGEYDAASGTAVAEHIYLNDWPVGVIVSNTLYYVHPDHLGAPRTITLPATNQSVWTWQREPFGNNPPNSNPNGLGTFLYNLRFPGQYYDQETGLHYNYYRDYDPSIGRYVESDPIGLAAGLNTYAYVGSNPLGFTDPEGLNPIIRGGLAAALAAARAAKAAMEKGYNICKKIRCTIAIHDAHHEFGWPFNQKMCHVQLNCWLDGVKGSGMRPLRFPYPCSWPGAGGAAGAGAGGLGPGDQGGEGGDQ